ncbi:MFS transporter [Cellulomonas hominis]|jgi:MFS family permease|uniref:MFS family permease n=2 Tax=Cellulomonas hominis TaxID=156981 RepID=A0A511F8R3_9CELL|nr:MFS family permease [Cellulomonas hominis]MBU5421927.1 MFS transporter [Cellulomonas hominis]NKY06704.1 SLC45 family MFS transporter [Cellulomonas hominis]NKY11829.1 SLC45 family MFS transporter [Cellulomonas hominis]GEL45613.1 MFS transporter [Cellulomonas hominis]
MATDTAAVTVDSQSGRPVYNLSKALHRRLIWTLSGNFLFLLALYNAVISVFLPNTVQKITDAAEGGGDKVVALATIMTVSSFLTIFAQPLAGAISDRTRSRIGMRAPFILGGSFVGGAAIAMLAPQSSMLGIGIFWVIASVMLNVMNGPLATVLADRVEPQKRGVASGFIGAAQTGGGTLGIIFGGWIANKNLPLGYVIFGVGIFLVCLVFVAANREPSTKDMVVEPFSWKQFFSQFWVSPRKHPDFGWAFFGRFFMYLGYQGVVAYQLYILRDYIGQSDTQSNITIGLMSTIQLVTLILSSVVSGYLSDKFQARKPFVFISSVIMAASYVVPLLWRTETGMLVMAAVLGLGYGCYMSIDMALMTQVLPNKGANAGKDMGVLTIATNLPQMLTQPLVAILLAISSGSYVIIFVWAIILVFSSAFMVMPIKSVK